MATRARRSNAERAWGIYLASRLERCVCEPCAFVNGCNFVPGTASGAGWKPACDGLQNEVSTLRNGGKSDMPSERVDEILLTNYLLGKLSEEEAVQVEDRAFAGAAYRGELEAAEADLIDAYVRGDLTQSDRREFERRFLTSPGRRGKVEL